MEPSLKIIRVAVLLASVSVIVLSVKAQPNMAFYPFDDHFNSSGYNPSFLTSREKFTFSIFPVGGTSLGFNNQKAIGDLVFKFLNGISTDEDFRDVLNSMVDQSTFHQNVESTLLSFTYRSKIGFFNFRIKENESFSASAEGELTKFILKSDIRSVTVNQIQELPAQVVHHREYSLGYSYKSRMNNFSAGIRAKLYYGKLALYSGLSGSIQNESNEFILKTSGLVNISFPEEKETKSVGTPNFAAFSSSKIASYLLNNGNPGFGLDLGIKYNISPKLTLSVSAIDLGRISWKTNLNSKFLDGAYRLPASTYKYTNEGDFQIVTKTIDNFSYSDSVSSLFDLNYDHSAFIRPMPINVYAGIKYELDADLSISFTNRYFILKDLSYYSFAITANYDVNKKLSISSGYALIGNSYVNIPLAILFKRNFGQIYLGTDNLSSILIPSMSDFAGVSFGVCFFLFQKRHLFGTPTEELPFYKPRKIKKKKSDGLLIKTDPDV